MHKGYYIVLALVWLAVAGCGRVNGSEEDSGRELIVDARFERGAALSPLWPHIVQQGGGFSKTCTDTLRFAESELEPIWQLCQWSSRYDLAGAEATAQGLGTCILGWLDDEEIRGICGLEETVRLVITLGYAKDGDPLRTKKRKDLSELVTVVE